MLIRSQTLVDVEILFLKGRLDSTSVKELKNKVTSLNKVPKVNLVIDLEEVDFIDSSGLGSLVASYRLVSHEGGDVKLASPSPQAQSLLELTRMDKLFDIFDNPFKAAESFEKTVPLNF